MRILLQRVQHAAVRSEGETIGVIERGLLLFVAIGPRDNEDVFRWMANKVSCLRLFPDEQERLAYDIRDIAGSFLVVPQFTLYANAERGRRPSLAGGAPPALAKQQFAEWCVLLAKQGIPLAQGRFAAAMQVELVNDGPFTLWLEKEG